MKTIVSNKLFLAALFLFSGILAVETFVSRQASPSTSSLETNEIKRTEDNQYVYYNVVLDNAKPKNLEVKVDDQKILISGKLEFQNRVDGNSQSYFSNFQKSILVPNNIDTRRYEMQQADGKITLKFKKSAHS